MVVGLVIAGDRRRREHRFYDRRLALHVLRSARRDADASITRPGDTRWPRALRATEEPGPHRVLADTRRTPSGGLGIPQKGRRKALHGCGLGHSAPARPGDPLKGVAQTI